MASFLFQRPVDAEKEREDGWVSQVKKGWWFYFFIICIYIHTYVRSYRRSRFITVYNATIKIPLPLPSTHSCCLAIYSQVVCRLESSCAVSTLVSTCDLCVLTQSSLFLSLTHSCSWSSTSPAKGPVETCFFNLNTNAPSLGYWSLGYSERLGPMHRLIEYNPRWDDPLRFAYSLNSAIEWLP